MRRLLITAAAASVALLVLPLGALAQPQTLELTVRDTRLAPDGTTEVVVNVTGSGVPDVLDAGAFTVTEQGEPVSGLEVEPLVREGGSGDVVVSLVVDTSGSMQGDPIEEVRTAAIDAVDVLVGLGIPVSLIDFNTTAEVLSPPTQDRASLVAAIESMEADGFTALYDAIIVATQELATVPDAQANMVVLADGEDNRSSASSADAIAAANDAGVSVTVIALETDILDVDVLEPLAAETGGRLVRAENTDEIASVFETAVRDIASQYVLRYSSDRLEPSSLDLSVSVSVAAGSASTDFSVLNVREAQPTGPRIIDPAPASPFSDPLLLYVAIAAAFAAMLLVFGLMFTGSRTRAEKVLGDQLARYIDGGDTRAGRSSLVAAHFRDRAMELFEASPRPRRLDEKLSLRLEQASWPLRNGEFVAMVVLGGLGVTVLFGLVFNWLGGILVGLVAASVPFLILARRRAKRHDQFLRALPDTLQLLAGSLRAGYGVLQAIDSVAKESDGVVAQEFGRVLTEARLGMPLEQALEDMATRIDNDDFRWVVLAINIQREVGGNLAELLDTVAEVLREREMLRRQIKVLSAEGRLSAVVLIGLPIFLAIYLILVRPEYISVLVTSGLFGWLLVSGAAFLMLVGVIWIRNLIRIEV